jgi:hypothetical protein
MSMGHRGGRESRVSRRISIFLSMLVLCLGITSCKKLEQGPIETAQGQLKSEPAPFADAIPAGYGRLVGVSPVSEGWDALWFEKPDRTLVVVGINWSQGEMLDQVVVIPRR